MLCDTNNWYSFSKILEMVEQNQTFAERASIDRPPLFTGENYPF